MLKPISFRTIIELWPSREAMAVEIGAKPWAVSKWWQRDSIPAEWWSAVLATPIAQKSSLSAEQMAGLVARAPFAELAEARP
jgi:hypothetical protein